MNGMKSLFSLFALVLVLEGIPYFACPDKMKNWMRRILEVPDSHLRIAGFLAMCAGLAMAFLFR